jgi:ribokinase
MPGPVALFAGDVCQDTTFVLPHMPASDEKIHVEAFVESLGGVACNAAVACLRAGAQTRLLTTLGEDGASAVLKQELERLGLAVEIETIPGRAARVVILVDASGEKRLLLAPGVSMYPQVVQAQAARLDDVAWLHTAPYGDAAHVLVARCRAAGIAWSLDLEPATLAGGLQAMRPLIDGASSIFCNERAAAMLGVSPERSLLAMGAMSVVMTRGSKGVRYIEPDGRETAIRCDIPVEVRDTTGAGDCLAGWYVAGRLRGEAAVDALYRAVWAATFSCETIGSHPSYPDSAALEAFLARGRASMAIGGQV